MKLQNMMSKTTHGLYMQHPEKKASEEIMKLEKPFMEALIHSLKPHGDVLQIGFGSGHAAHLIQKHHPKSHTIIEYDMNLVQDARKWASNISKVTIIQDDWKTALPLLGVFDTISFNELPIILKGEIKKTSGEVNQAQMILKKGNELLHMVQETLPEITHIKYSTQDLNGLCKSAPKESYQQLSHFLYELKCNDQITEIQYEETLQKHNLIRNESTKYSSGALKRSTLIFDLVSVCLGKNMRKKSKLACLISPTASNYEDPVFFDKIITNPFVEYQEYEISIKIPDSKEESSVLIMSVEKF